jgi:anti-sigma factor RsiW
VLECRYCEKLGAYRDGQLDATAWSMLEQHLGRCPFCAAELDRLGRLSALLKGAGAVEMPAEAMRRFHATAEAAGSFSLHRLAEALTAVAAAILVACALWMWSPSTAGGPTGAPVWEASVLQRPSETPAGQEDQFAVWVVQDLSWENGHDSN